MWTARQSTYEESALTRHLTLLLPLGFPNFLISDTQTSIVDKLLCLSLVTATQRDQDRT